MAQEKKKQNSFGYYEELTAKDDVFATDVQ